MREIHATLQQVEDGQIYRNLYIVSDAYITIPRRRPTAASRASLPMLPPFNDDHRHQILMATDRAANAPTW